MRLWCVFLTVLVGCHDAASERTSLQERYIRECQVHDLLASRLILAEKTFTAANQGLQDDDPSENKLARLNAESAIKRLDEMLSAQSLRVHSAELDLYTSMGGK